MTKSSPNKPGHEHWFGLLLASQRFAMMRSNVVILTFATFTGIARAFTCDGPKPDILACQRTCGVAKVHSFRRLAWYLLHVETHLSTVGRFVQGNHRSIDPS